MEKGKEGEERRGSYVGQGIKRTDFWMRDKREERSGCGKGDTGRGIWTGGSLLPGGEIGIR